MIDPTSYSETTIESNNDSSTPVEVFSSPLQDNAVLSEAQNEKYLDSEINEPSMKLSKKGFKSRRYNHTWGNY